MSKKTIENYIPKAQEAITKFEIEKNGEVPKQFNGYIASFGASVRQAGLLATTLFYSEKGGAEEERGKVVQAIEYIIGEKIIKNNRVEKSIRPKVEDAAVALKLCVRTFKLV